MCLVPLSGKHYVSMVDLVVLPKPLELKSVPLGGYSLENSTYLSLVTQTGVQSIAPRTNVVVSEDPNSCLASLMPELSKMRPAHVTLSATKQLALPTWK